MKNVYSRVLMLAAWIAMFASAIQARPGLPAGLWEGAIAHEGKTWRVAVHVGGGDSPAVQVDLLDYGVLGIPFTFGVEGERAKLERKQPNGSSILFEGKLDGDVWSGTFKGVGITDGFILRRSVAKPALLTEERVEFSHGPVRLVGTLILPPGPGPHPAVVCIHGSNPDDRNRAGYRSEGVMFARMGVAALIYDKRGVGESTGDYQTASIEDLAGDALAGLAALKGRKDIDPKRLGVTGTSQGGWVSPAAAIRSRDVSFVVVISASGLNPMEQSIFHRANVMREAGFSEENVKRASALRRRLYERARKGAFDDRLVADLEAASREPWFEASALPFPVSDTLAEGTRQLLLFEPGPVWEQVKVPVLAIWGANDINVPADHSRTIIDRALAKAGVAERNLAIFPNADHGLAVVRDPKAGWDFPRQVPGVRELIERWIELKLKLS